MESIQTLMNHQLVVLAGGPVTVASIVVAVALLFGSIVISWMVRRVVRRSLTKSDPRGRTVNVVERLSHYAILLLGIGISLDTIGIDLSALFAAGAIFAIGIGFAMQSIAQNFVSGVILLIERTVSIGDILQVDGRVVRVEVMGIRSTIVRTQDEEHLIVPNSVLVQSTVANYTLSDSLFRIHGKVRVTYKAELPHVLEALQGLDIPWQSQRRKAEFRLTDFGDSSMNFEVLAWIDDPWAAPRLVSELNKAIWSAFKQHEITIAFPQLDVHFDPPVVDRLAPRPLAIAHGG